MPTSQTARQSVSRLVEPQPSPQLVLPETFPGSTHGKSTLQRLLATGEIRRVAPGVFTREHAPLADTYSSRLWEHKLRISASTWKLSPDEVVSHLSGAVLWNLWGFDPPSLVHTIAPRRYPRQPIGRRRVFNSVPPEDLTERSGVPVTGLERTAIDAMRVVPMHRALAIADRALYFGASREGMVAINESLISNRKRAVCSFLLPLAHAGADSPPEAYMRLLGFVAGIRELVPQLRVRIQGESFYLDAGDPTIRLALEYDGKDKYALNPHALYREKLREDALRATGWTVLRLTSNDLRNPANVVLRIERILERLGASTKRADFPGRSTLFAHWR